MSFIVPQDSSGHAEYVDNALQELNYCFLYYVYHWGDLNPLGERINAKE
jgi:hypothetical protein